MNYTIYTDGAYSSKRNQGGMAFIILKDDRIITEFSKTVPNTTSNKMELGAIILALRCITKPINSITIISDSMYCIGCITLNWKRKKNKKMWNTFDEEFNRVQGLCDTITFKHTKGHSNDLWNNYVDRLANLASIYENKN